MALSAFLGLFLQNRLVTDHVFQIVTTFFLGGVLGWPPAITLAKLMAVKRHTIAAHTITVLVLAGSTLAVTALVFALQYRMFYAQWHEPALSRIWFFQQLFTSAGAAYQFAVLGSRLYLPAGPLCLVAATYALCRRMR